MKDLFDSLTHILHKMVGLHRQMLDVLRSEKIALTEGSISKIEAYTKEKLSLIAQVNTLEKKRSEALVSYGLPPLTIQQLSELALQKGFPQEAKQLQQNQIILITLIQHIQKIQEQTTSLIHTSLEHLSQLRKNHYYKQCSSPETRYNEKGIQKTLRTKGIPSFLNKEV